MLPTVADDDPVPPLDPETVERVRDVLSSHPVAFAMVFGSRARGAAEADSDVDLAVEFDDVRPAEDGYSSVYFRLLTDLTDALDAAVDVVDVRSMSPRFARAAFDASTVVYGTEARKRRLADGLTGEPISLNEARTRVSEAVKRMQK